MMNNRLSTLRIFAAAALVAITPLASQAKDFPKKDITIIVPFDPGGAVDVTSRILAEYANKELEGVKMKIENRAGGGGVVGQTMAAKAKKDGYTILAMTSSVVTNPKLKKVQYAVSDFEPVALYTMDPEVIAVSKDSPYTTIEEFIAAAKEKELNLTLAGVGTSHDLGAKALKLNNPDLKLKLINTKSFSEQLQAVLGNHVDGAIWPFGEAKSHMDAGSIRVLAVAATERMASFPDIPTWKEKDLNIEEWVTFRGWAAPKGVDSENIAFLSDLMKKINENPEYVEKMNAQGFPIAYRDAAGYKAVIDNYDILTDQVIQAGAK